MPRHRSPPADLQIFEFPFEDEDLIVVSLAPTPSPRVGADPHPTGAHHHYGLTTTEQ